MARPGSRSREPGTLAWAFGPPAVPAVSLLLLLAVAISALPFVAGSFSVTFHGAGRGSFWVVVLGLLAAFAAWRLRVAIRSRGARVVAHRGGEEVATERDLPAPTPPTSWARTRRR